MSAVLVVLRLLLAGVFAVAAVAKLADPSGARRAARELGGAEWLATPAAALLPLAELGIGAGLVFGATARGAAAGAAVMLMLFSLMTAVALARGRRPSCHCFGRIHSAPAGAGTLLRNAALTVVAVAVAARPAADPSGVELTGVAVAEIVAGLALLAGTLLRRYGEALRRIDELESGRRAAAQLAVGDEAPAFAALPELLRPGRPVLLVFVAGECGPCRALPPQIDEWRRDLAERLTIGLVDDTGVATLYGVEATPSAVLVGPDGRVAATAAAGRAAIEALVRELTASAEPAPGIGRRAAAAALAGGIAAATVAQAASGRPRGGSQEPSDPELKAIAAAFERAGPAISAADQRTRKAVRAQATLRGGKNARARRAAASRALASERGHADRRPSEPEGGTDANDRDIGRERRLARR